MLRGKRNTKNDIMSEFGSWKQVKPTKKHTSLVSVQKPPFMKKGYTMFLKWCKVICLALSYTPLQEKQ